MSNQESTVNPEETARITTNDILVSLQERVSVYSASLLLESALLATGIQSSDKLNITDAKNLCLALIKKGGPAFQVGQALYRRI